MNSLDGIQHLRSIVQMHSSWIALNPLQGCPKRCSYCFLNEWDKTHVQPKVIATPSEAVRELLASSFFSDKVPVCILTHTDAMATIANKLYFVELLHELLMARVTHPVCFVTKCEITSDILNALDLSRSRGLNIIAYLSHSGLTTDQEPGIHIDTTISSFGLLSAIGIPSIHYWRPIIPENASMEVLLRVHESVRRICSASVVTGLKLYPYSTAESWPEIRPYINYLSQYEGVLPDGSDEHFRRIAKLYPSYPIFDSNSCAISYVLRKPDSVHIYGSPSCCTRSNCPITQRRRCAVSWEQNKTRVREVTPPASVVATTEELAQIAFSTGDRRVATREENDFYWCSSFTASHSVLFPSLRKWNGVDNEEFDVELLQSLVVTAAKTRMVFDEFEGVAWDGYAVVSELCVQTGHLFAAYVHDKGEGDVLDAQLQETWRKSHFVIRDEWADCMLQTLTLAYIMKWDARDFSCALDKFYAVTSTISIGSCVELMAVCSSSLMEIAMRSRGLRSNLPQQDESDYQCFNDVLMKIICLLYCISIKKRFNIKRVFEMMLIEAHNYVVACEDLRPSLGEIDGGLQQILSMSVTAPS